MSKSPEGALDALRGVEGALGTVHANIAQLGAMSDINAVQVRTSLLRTLTELRRDLVSIVETISPRIETTSQETDSIEVADKLGLGDQFTRVREGLIGAGGGGITLHFQDGRWLVATEFGREAPDSPMVGGASYGQGDTLAAALADVLRETRW